GSGCSGGGGRVARGAGVGLLGGKESNPHSQYQKLLSCRWTTPERFRQTIPGPRFAPTAKAPLTSAPAMGSLIKKRRKRMRKKKHKKMLKATRWQRRAGK
ncbi:MAG: hypothetical protein QOG03_114, partial [Actinomycetota bacterium]|nr:hypothetical protein [Actinomycetota bacterium]